VIGGAAVVKYVYESICEWDDLLMTVIPYRTIDDYSDFDQFTNLSRRVAEV
jgi:hypothetical protein